MTTTSIKSALISQFPEVFAAYAEDLHPHVEQALFYSGDAFSNGTLSKEELKADIYEIATTEAQCHNQALESDATYNALRVMVYNGEITNNQFANELKDEFTLGQDSLLHRFISLQNITCAKNAAVSFLAWKHTKALFDLENEFDVQLNEFRDQREEEFFGTSESQMTILNFSVLQGTPTYSQF